MADRSSTSLQRQQQQQERLNKKRKTASDNVNGNDDATAANDIDKPPISSRNTPMSTANRDLSPSTTAAAASKRIARDPKSSSSRLHSSLSSATTTTTPTPLTSSKKLESQTTTSLSQPPSENNETTGSTAAAASAVGSVTTNDDDNCYKPLTLTEIRDRFPQLCQRVPVVPSQGLDPNNRMEIREWASQLQAVLEEFNLLVCCISTATYKWGTDRSGAADQHLAMLSSELVASQDQISSAVTPRLTNILAPVVDLVVDRTIVTTTTTTTPTPTVALSNNNQSNTTNSSLIMDTSSNNHDNGNTAPTSQSSNAILETSSNDRQSKLSSTNHHSSKKRKLHDSGRASRTVKGYDHTDDYNEEVHLNNNTHEDSVTATTQRSQEVVVQTTKQNIFDRKHVDQDFLELCHTILCRNASLLRQVVLSNFYKLQQCLSDYLDATQKDSYVETSRGFAY